MDVREKLVELLKKAKAKEQYDFLFGDIDTAIDMPYGAEYYADHLIANGVTVQEWFSVKDRLPGKEEYTTKAEDGTEYYVRLLIAYKTDIVGYKIGYYDGYKWMTEMPIQLIKDVVAWMPFPNLPQPPKGE